MKKYFSYIKQKAVALGVVATVAVAASAPASAAIPTEIQGVFTGLLADVPLYTAAAAGVLAVFLAGSVGLKLAKKFVSKAT